MYEIEEKKIFIQSNAPISHSLIDQVSILTIIRIINKELSVTDRRTNAKCIKALP